MAVRSFMSRSLTLRQLSTSWNLHRSLGFSTVLHTDNSIVWPDAELGVFAKTDPRFALPGNVGLAEEELSPHPSTDTPLPDVLSKSTRWEHQTQTLYTAHDFIQFTPGADKELCSELLIQLPDMEGVKNLECAIHDAPRLLKKEVQFLFPDRGVMNEALSVITLSQRTIQDMSMYNEEVEEEREKLTEHFIAVAKEISARLRNENFWCDFIDPSSGLPYFESNPNYTLLETNEKYRLLGFRIEDLGCCKIICHKDFGRHVFVGTIFTNASSSSGVIQELITELNLMEKGDTVQ